MNLYGFVWNDPLSYRDHLGTFTVSSAKFYEKKPRCGDATFMYELKIGKDEDGWIIQHVTRETVVEKKGLYNKAKKDCCCRDHTAKTSEDFYEAFRVRPGQVFSDHTLGCYGQGDCSTTDPPCNNGYMNAVKEFALWPAPANDKSKCPPGYKMSTSSSDAPGKAGICYRKVQMSDSNDGMATWWESAKKTTCKIDLSWECCDVFFKETTKKAACN